MKLVISAVLLLFIVFGTHHASTKPDIPSQAEQAVSRMTLDEKLGQMLMPDFRNWQKKGHSSPEALTQMNDEVAGLIQKYRFGGVILFAENVKKLSKRYA